MSEEILNTPEADENSKGMRLDKYLAICCAGYSRSRLQNLIASGCVVLDDNIVITDNSYKVKEGDIFQVCVPEVSEAVPEPENIPLDIFYEDDDIMVVNKPAGMTVHPGAGINSGTLVNALLYHCKNLAGIGGVKRPGIVHRIDKDTSGLLVVAKNDNAHHKLSEQFAEHSIERTYFAVVYGVLNPLAGTIEGNIARSNFDRKKMAMVACGGKTAITHYKTLHIFGKTASLVQCNLETGRTHQIRVHLSSKGNNLIGDKVYEKAKKTMILAPAEIKAYINNFPRQALHAASLGFLHPVRGEFLQFEAPLPDDIQKLLEKLQEI